MPVDLSKINVHWFPGHMAHGLRAMEKRLESAVCLVELRDARIPVSSSNPLITRLAEKMKLKHFVAFNKVDLARSAPLKREMDRLYEERGVKSMALRGASEADTKRLIHNLTEYLKDIEHDSSRPLRIMISGIPNVGKSTLINSIRTVSVGREVKAARTGSLPGVTRVVSEQIKISETPKVYLWDSPGILVPKITDPEVGMRLAATGAVMDRQVGEYLIAEYILDRIGAKSKRLRELLKTETIPTDMVSFIEVYARRMQLVEKSNQVNTFNAVTSFLKKFRDGALGKVCLDE